MSNCCILIYVRSTTSDRPIWLYKSLFHCRPLLSRISVFPFRSPAHYTPSPFIPAASGPCHSWRWHSTVFAHTACLPRLTWMCWAYCFTHSISRPFLLVTQTLCTTFEPQIIMRAATAFFHLSPSRSRLLPSSRIHFNDKRNTLYSYASGSLQSGPLLLLYLSYADKYIYILSSFILISFLPPHRAYDDWLWLSFASTISGNDSPWLFIVCIDQCVYTTTMAVYVVVGILLNHFGRHQIHHAHSSRTHSTHTTSTQGDRRAYSNWIKMHQWKMRS